MKREIKTILSLSTCWWQFEMKATNLQTSIEDFQDPEILSLNYDLKNLTIEFDANKRDQYWITFDYPIGFKCLDEGDMLNYWEDPMITDHWLLRINEGGWLDNEITNGGFTSNQVNENIFEYLIRGVNECISVISTDQPEIKKKK